MTSILMDAESKASYEYSISNLLMLMILHDANVDVSGYGNYRVEVGFMSNPGYDFLMRGMNDLGFVTKHATIYTDDPEEISLAKQIESVINRKAEWYIVLNSFKVEKILRSSSQKDEYIAFVKSTLNHIDLECEAFVEESLGIIIGFIFDGFYHELLSALIEVADETNNIYEKLEEQQNGHYLSA